MSGDGWAYAFCAPGGKALAGLTLMLNGEDAPEVREHPYLTGLKPGQVILMRDPEKIEPPFLPFSERSSHDLGRNP